MDGIEMEKGAAPTAPVAPLSASGSTGIYPLPVQYRKPIRFWVNSKVIRLTGGRALVLDRLIAAGPAGIDRAATLQWVANLADTIAALRASGIVIETRKGQAANYVLACAAYKLGGAA